MVSYEQYPSINAMTMLTGTAGVTFGADEGAKPFGWPEAPGTAQSFGAVVSTAMGTGWWWWRGALMAVMLSASVIPVLADQNAENLDKLFDELAAAKYPTTAQQIEREIWRTWLESGDVEVDEKLRAGMRDMSAGNLEASIEHFTQVVEMAPEFAEGWNKRATAHFYNNEPAKSMRDIQRTLSLEPRHFGAISGMGLIFLQQGDERSALEAFEQVLEIHPMAGGANAQVERLKKKLGSGI